MATCQIKWIDKAGQTTPDNNTAIGRVKLLSYVSQHQGRAVAIPESDWFYCCGDHAARLSDPGMEHWIFEALEIKD